MLITLNLVPLIFSKDRLLFPIGDNLSTTMLIEKCNRKKGLKTFVLWYGSCVKKDKYQDKSWKNSITIKQWVEKKTGFLAGYMYCLLLQKLCYIIDKGNNTIH